MATSELSLLSSSGIPARHRASSGTPFPRPRSRDARTGSDRVALSSAAQNIHRVRKLAAELVARLHPDLSALERLSLTTALEERARVLYADELEGGLLSADLLKGWLWRLGVGEAAG